METKTRRLIDSHFHVFDLKFRDQLPNKNPSHGFPSEAQTEIHRNHLIEEAESVMDCCGVKNAVFVQCYNDSEEEIEWVVKEAADHKFLKAIVGGLDITNPDKLKQSIAKYSNIQPPLVGVRHLIDFEEDDFLLRPDVLAGLKVLSDSGLTFDLQSYPATLQHVATVASKLPQLKMVIDHIGKPEYVRGDMFQEWAKDISEAAKHKNVYCKLSGLINEVPFWSPDSYRKYVLHCIQEFGPERCMFGSDWPVCKLAKPYDGYSSVIKLLEDLTEDLTEDDKDKIFYQNVISFYGLKNVTP